MPIPHGDPHHPVVLSTAFEQLTEVAKWMHLEKILKLGLSIYNKLYQTRVFLHFLPCTFLHFCCLLAIFSLRNRNN